jgi:hypothetical protein
MPEAAAADLVIVARLPNGQTEWIPPPGVPLIGGTNTYHHPERLLPRDPDDP